MWSLLRKFHKVAGSFATVKKIQHRRLVLYGMAAFLWEREKIPEEEVQRYMYFNLRVGVPVFHVVVWFTAFVTTETW